MRTRLAALIALALVIVPSAATQPTQTSVSAPTNLRGFLLRPNEPVTHTFPRTPAFAWAPVRGARCYQFELAATRTFTENSLVWSNVSYKVGAKVACGVGGQTLTVPAAAVDVALPWFTGQPSALYAHVRAITSSGVSPWSKPFAFDMRWNNVPESQSAQPGLLRWTPVSGATGYDVWLVDRGHIYSTSTNVGDMREYYADDAPATSAVRWRVRAVRRLYGKIPSGLESVSHGPWSKTFTTAKPALTTGSLQLTASISDRASDAESQRSHELMPGFAFRGDGGTGLFRVYVSTDRDCVNVVFRGPTIGGGAYAPRTAGSGLADGTKTFSADYTPFVTNEAVKAAKTGTGSTDAGQTTQGARVDLPDTGFPTTRYYWTVVPVGTLASPDGKGGGAYRDLELPQDACAAGRIQSFSKASEPVVIAAGGAPYLSGLSPNGRLLAAARRAPSVYGSPVVAWQPAVAALQYEVQWSRTRYPWNAVGAKRTFATSALLDLAPGRWFYRVRGLNPDRIGKPQMTWSAPVELRVAKPRFAVVGG